MDINKTGPRKAHLPDPPQKGGQTQASPGRLSLSANETHTSDPHLGVAAGVSPADIKDPNRLDETVMRCFGSFLENAGENLGISLSESQKRHLLEFMSNDPIMRGKLCKYLEQVVK